MTKILLNKKGKAKFKSHIIVLIVTIVSAFNSTKPNINTATKPFIAHLKIIKHGMVEVIK